MIAGRVQRVGFAVADGVLHWHYRQAHLLRGDQRPSPRFIRMANKETDRLTSCASQWTGPGTRLRGPAASWTFICPTPVRGAHAVCLVGYRKRTASCCSLTRHRAPD